MKNKTTLIQVELPDEINTWLMHKTIDLSHHDKRTTIVSILKNQMDKEKKQ